MAQYSRVAFRPVASVSCSGAIYCLPACSEFRCSSSRARNQQAADGSSDGCRLQWNAERTTNSLALYNKMLAQPSAAMAILPAKSHGASAL